MNTATQDTGIYLDNMFAYASYKYRIILNLKRRLVPSYHCNEIQHPR